MARYETKHSRVVATAKIVLPLLSLALLATLFLFARSTPHELSIPYARVDLETLAREQRLDGASFSTVLDDGGQISLAADTVRPDLSDPRVVNSSAILGDMTLPDGSRVDLRADSAVIDRPSMIAELAGGVRVETSTNYTIVTERLAAMLDVSRIESSGSVNATGPIGTFDAGHMIVTRDAESGRYLLVFKGGVKLVYQPKQ